MKALTMTAGHVSRQYHYWSWSFATAITYDSRSRATYGICFELDTSEINRFLDDIIKAIHLAICDLFIPAVLVDLALEVPQGYNHKYHRDLDKIQSSLGILQYIKADKIPQENFDLAQASRQLTAVSVSSAAVLSLLQRLKNTVEGLQEQLCNRERKPKHWAHDGVLDEIGIV
ncbi:hypothetical protein BCR34DRAFT_90944 [Clohesyomyces aquaticus]|uniref:Uncharacterized protein n=1 Tax=Clohesyomyces aquaticus TaxID=1231657 RepID=A0A1Y1YUM0_9PLEO|nr:hypothetical protein BCR34DRAFT_90944 [Clohesyomyces aquaticus]